MSVPSHKSRESRAGGWSRRQLFRLAGALGAGLGGSLAGSRVEAAAAGALTAAAGGAASAAAPPLADAAVLAAAPADPAAANALYESLGVRPLINCRGTLTRIGGSMELPEVRAAKDAANQRYVQIDELMEAIGKRLAELTGAEWGMVSAGCAAAMSHATAACVAGGNPDLHVRIPNLAGFAKDEVIIPAHSRNVYDAAIRAVGVRIIEVESPDALQLAIGPRTAMIYVFANDRNESGPFSLEAIAAIAKPHNVPILVDAAAEVLTVPNIHLQRGATLVAYSGGKIIRGPQSAGLLLGRKDLVRAAWVHSAPHHGYARAMKVGREEMIGMVVAVESWVKRDHDAEWRKWTARCEHIAAKLRTIPGVTTAVSTALGGRSNRSPRLTVRWDSTQLGLTGEQVAELLDTTSPRIALNAARPPRPGSPNQTPELKGDTGLGVNAATMADGDEVIVANRLHELLTRRPAVAMPAVAAAPLDAPAAAIAGQWRVEITYAAGKTQHTFYLQQDGNRLRGTHQGDFQARDINGTISRDKVSLASIVTERHGDSLEYRFTGSAADDKTMSGTLDMGEYLSATWSATRQI